MKFPPLHTDTQTDRQTDNPVSIHSLNEVIFRLTCFDKQGWPSLHTMEYDPRLGVYVSMCE